MRTSAATQPIAIGVRQQQDRLGDVPDRALGEARLVVVDQRDDVAAGDVAKSTIVKPVRVEVETRCR